MEEIEDKYKIMVLQVRVMTLLKILVEKGIATEEEIQEKYEIETERFFEHLEKKNQEL